MEKERAEKEENYFGRRSARDKLSGMLGIKTTWGLCSKEGVASRTGRPL